MNRCLYCGKDQRDDFAFCSDDCWDLWLDERPDTEEVED